MFKIQYQGLQNKQIALPDGTIGLRKNVSMQILGEAPQIKLFLQNLQLGNPAISFLLNEEVLERQMILDRTIFITCQPSLDKRQRIESALKHHVSDDEVNRIIRICGLEEKRLQRIKTLSFEEKMKLQLYLYASQNTILWVFDDTWKNADPTIIKVVEDILKEAMQKQGCYILTATNFSKMFVNGDEYSLCGEHTTEFISTYLDEDIKIQPIISSTKKRHIPVHFSKIILMTIFLLSIFVTTLLNLNYFFVGRYEIQIMNAEAERRKEMESFPIQIRYCDNVMLSYDCAAKPVEESMTAIEGMLGNIDATIAPRYSAQVTMGKNESYFFDENQNPIPLVLADESYNSSFSNNIEFFDDPNEISGTIKEYQKEGVYVSQAYLDDYEGDIDVSNARFRASLYLPVYLMEQKGYTSEGMAGTIKEEILYQPLYRVYEFDVPVAGVVEEEFGYRRFYFNQSEYVKILNEVGYEKPYAASQEQPLYMDVGGVDISDIDPTMVRIYHPQEYRIDLKSEQDAINAKAIFDRNPKDIMISSYFTSVDESLTYVYEMQIKVRSFLLPYVLISILITIAIAFFLRRKDRKQPRIYLEKKSWKKKIIIPCVVATGFCIVHFLISNVFKEQILFGMESFMYQLFQNNFHRESYWLLYNLLYSMHLDALCIVALFLFTYVLVSLIYVPEWIQSLRTRFQK